MGICSINAKPRVQHEVFLIQSSRRKFLWLGNFRPLTPPLMRFRKRRFNQLHIWHASRRSSCSWRLAQMRLVFRCLLLYVPNRYEQAAHIGFHSRRFYMLPSGVHPASLGSLPYSAVFSSVSIYTFGIYIEVSYLSFWLMCITIQFSHRNQPFFFRLIIFYHIFLYMSVVLSNISSLLPVQICAL